MERFYSFSGLVICAKAQSQWFSHEKGVLENFECEPTQTPSFTMEFEMVEQLPKHTGELLFFDNSQEVYKESDAYLKYVGKLDTTCDSAYMCIKRKNNHSIVFIKKQSIHGLISDKTILNAMEAEHLVVNNDGFLLHSSFIQVNNTAVLFTANSGVGKSTQADLWVKHKGAQLINGDRAVVRIRDNRVLACGIPFSGSSNVRINTQLPLKAIVVLSQSSTNTIERLTGYIAFRKIWEGCSLNVWNKNDVDRCSDTVQRVLSQIPVYHLACTPDINAVNLLESVLI